MQEEKSALLLVPVCSWGVGGDGDGGGCERRRRILVALVRQVLSHMWGRSLVRWVEVVFR